MMDLALNEEGDLSLTGTGDLRIFSATTAVRQYVALNLIIMQGTLRYDRSFGSRLTELIGGKNLGVVERETVANIYVMAGLHSCPYVKKINSVTVRDKSAYDNSLIVDVDVDIYLSLTNPNNTTQIAFSVS